MKKILLVAGFGVGCLGAFAQNKVNPVIRHYGTVSEVPYAVEKPDTKMNYKVVVEVNTDNPKPDATHEFFEKTAAAVNLHALGGISNPLGMQHAHALTDREREFLILACTEFTYKEIAERMAVSPRTVDGYREDLFFKLGVRSRVGLVLYAIKQGIVHV